MMDELAALCADPALSGRLRSTADAAAAEVPIEARWHAAVTTSLHQAAPLLLSAVPYRPRDGRSPLPSSAAAVAASAAEAPALAVLAGIEQARGLAQGLLRRFEPDGSVRYQAAGEMDYGRTHFSAEASGYTAEPVFRLLEAAVFAGDSNLVQEGLRLARVLQRRFGHGVPRGAQTWEIPLHTPDIVASAYMVKAFALAFELTGEPRFLDAARYWAWTGVPFVYLVNPVEMTEGQQPQEEPEQQPQQSGANRVGPYATIPVLGATQWQAPNWIGLPVQWCGLVYADSLRSLARLDPRGPWRKLARGIAASGILQTYPLDHPHRGLLPDSFSLAAEARNPADINPGLLQPAALWLLAGDHPGAVPYAFVALRASGLWVHSPGAISVTADRPGSARFTINAWSQRPSFAVIHGLKPRGKTAPQVRLDGQPLPLGAPQLYLPERGTLILLLTGGTPAKLEIEAH